MIDTFNHFQSIVIINKLKIPKDIIQLIGNYCFSNPFNIDIPNKYISSNGNITYDNNKLLLKYNDKDYRLFIDDIIYHNKQLNYFDSNDEYFVMSKNATIDFKYSSYINFFIFKLSDGYTLEDVYKLSNIHEDIISKYHRKYNLFIINVDKQINFHISQDNLIYYGYKNKIIFYNIETKKKFQLIIENLDGIIEPNIEDVYIINDFKFIYVLNDTKLIIYYKDKIIKNINIIKNDFKFFYKNNIVYFYSYNVKFRFDLDELEIN